MDDSDATRPSLLVRSHDRLLKALSRYAVTKLVAEEYSLDDLFLEYYQHDENHQ